MEWEVGVSRCKLLCIEWINNKVFLQSTEFSSVQPLSRVRLLVTPRTAARQASLSIINSRTLLKLMSIESVMPSHQLILCHPLLLLPSIFPSIWVFSNESVLPIRWPKYWSLSFNIGPSNEYSGLISFRMDQLNLLAIQGTLKSLLQHHGSKASILWRSAFFIVQLGSGKIVSLEGRLLPKTAECSRQCQIDNLFPGQRIFPGSLS